MLVVDVDVPVCAFGDTVDWSVPYPELGAGPVTELPIFRYGSPADTAAKLHGKGNFELDDICILAGTAVTGAVSPNTSPAEGVCAVEITLLLDPGASAIWQFADDMPTSLTPAYTRIVDSTTYTPKIMGTDVGLTSLGLRFENTSVATDLDAGRLRIVMRGHEV